MIAYHAYNSEYSNPMYNVHKNVDAHYTWQNTISSLSLSSYLLLGLQ